MSSSNGRLTEEAGLRRQTGSEIENEEFHDSYDHDAVSYGEGMYQDSSIDSDDEDYVEENLASLPMQECVFVEDEEYLRELGLKEATIDTSDAGMKKIVRAHLMGALMADGVKMKEGITPVELNVNFNVVTNNAVNLQGLADLVVGVDDGLMKCRENPSNVLMHDIFKDMVKFDIPTGKFTAILKSDVMERLAEDVYRTAKANETRKEKDERHKKQVMETPECRKKYMVASDMLVQIMMACYNEKYKNPEDSKVSWNEVREMYKKMFDAETPHELARPIYERFNESLDLDSIGDTFNNKSLKPLFGRSTVKAFLACPIYSKIKIDYEGQMMLFFDIDDIKNGTLTYTAQDYQQVDEEIERSKTKSQPHFTSISKVERQKQELEERKKTFKPISMPTVHVPQVDKSANKNVFGGVEKDLPERVKQEYVPPGERDEEVKKPAAVPTMNRFGEVRSTQDQAQQQEEDSYYDSGSSISSDGERPQAREKIFTDDEDEDEQRRERDELARRKEEKRRQALEQRKGEATPPPQTSRFATTSQQSSQHSQMSGNIVIPTAPDRLGIPAAVETVEEKITSEAETSSPQNARLNTFVDNADKGQAIPDDMSLDDLFKPHYAETQKPTFERPQMPNEQHHIHVEEKEKQKLARLEKERQEKRREQQGAKSGSSGEESKKKEETRKPQEPPKQSVFPTQKRKNVKPEYGTQTFQEQSTFGKSDSTGFGFSNEPPRATDAPRATPGLFASKKVQEPAQESPQQQKSAFHRPAQTQHNHMPSTVDYGRNQMPEPALPQQANYQPNYQNQGFGNQGNQFGGYPPQQAYRPQQEARQPQYSENYQQRQQSPPYRENFQQQQQYQEPQQYQNFQQEYREEDRRGYREETRSNHSHHSQEYQGSSYGRPMSPPRPQLGSTTARVNITRRDIGTQSEPIDVLVEELFGKIAVANDNQDPNKMSPREKFLQFLKFHVCVFKDIAQAGKRHWSEIKKDLPQPLNDPEKLLGPNWENVIEKEVPQIVVNKLRKGDICFEWEEE